jgi:NADPH2:quinone reductase
MKAIRVHSPGGVEALRYEDVPEPQPKSGEALVRIEAAGVNFIDVYHRTGLYPVPLPFTPGQEGAGVVESAPGGSGIAPGDRVVWFGSFGSYAEKAAVPADRLVRIPDGVSPRQAAAAMLQGMTAQYLAVSTYPIREADACLVHAAAGGVGQLLCQVARRRGSTLVIGTVSSPEKARVAREAGAHETIDYTRQDFEAETRRLTQGRGVPVVYDSVGRATFEKSLGCLAQRGMLVLFGQSSGPVEPVDLQVLSRKGSLYVTRPTLFHYVATREELLSRSGDVLAWVRDGTLRLRIDRELPLADAARAHEALEGRKTAGKVLLVP